MAEATPEGPAYVVVGENMPREEWLERRKYGCGGSDAPAILGLSKYDGPLSVYASKVTAGDFKEDKEPRFRRLGRELEPAILRLAAEELRATAWHHTPNTLFRSTTWPWMLCTMDGYLIFAEEASGEPRQMWCEVKTGADAEDWKNGVPDAVFAQTQHQLAVTGADEIAVALFFTGFAADYAVTTVKRDETYLQDALIPAVESFWFNHVDPKIEEGLEVDGHEYTQKAIERLHPQQEADPWINCFGEKWLQKADELEALAERRKVIEADERKLKNEFRQQLAGGKRLLLSDGRYFSNSFIADSAPMIRKAHTQFRGPYGGGK